MAVYTMECTRNNADGSGATMFATLTQEIDADTIAVTDTIAYQTYAGSYLFNMARWGSAGRAFADQTIQVTEATNNVIYFYFTQKTYISEFSWTDDDANKIKQGALSSNLTAAAYNSFYQKLGAMKNLTGVTYRASNAVSAGDTVSSDNMGTLAEGIYRALPYLYGADSGVQDTFNTETYEKIDTGKPITAELLATGEYSLKSMLNKIIQALRP